MVVYVKFAQSSISSLYIPNKVTDRFGESIECKSGPLFRWDSVLRRPPKWSFRKPSLVMAEQSHGAMHRL